MRATELQSMLKNMLSVYVHLRNQNKGENQPSIDISFSLNKRKIDDELVANLPEEEAAKLKHIKGKDLFHLRVGMIFIGPDNIPTGTHVIYSAYFPRQKGNDDFVKRKLLLDFLRELVFNGCLMKESEYYRMELDDVEAKD